VNNSSGFSNQTITMGLLTGDSGGGPSYIGRLVGGDYSQGAGGNLNTATMADLAIDNAPLWSFLKNPLPPTAPPECRAAGQMSPKRDDAVANLASLESTNGLIIDGAPAYATPEDLMAGCLGKWASSDGPIFTSDFAKSRRAVAVPRYWETELGPASTNYHIRDFVPLFLTGEFQVDNTTHWAGDEIPENGPVHNAWNPNGNGQTKKLIVGEEGMYVPCGSLPEGICVASDTPGNDGFGGEVHGVTLTH
jgi:hypothetical protein